MRRIMLTVAYDGTNYCGWQFQPNGVTIEEKLNKALSKLFQTSIEVIGASRTDSGVHAKGNVAVFDTESRMPADKVCIALNQRLPEDIRVQSSCEVPLDFHPRKANCVKTYEYKILNRKIALPSERLYSHFCYFALDVERMRRAAACLVGEHDFKSFCAARSQTDETVRTIYALDITEVEDMITLRISGNGFLYNMVRIIVGTLLEIGKGARTPEYMEEILEARDRAAAGPTIPAKGLMLVGIEYEAKLPDEIRGRNKHWDYVLDQREVADGGFARLTIQRCEDEEFSAVMRRMVHQAMRNGARQVLAIDQEKHRIAAGMHYGLYEAVEEGNGWFSFIDNFRQEGLL